MVKFETGPIPGRASASGITHRRASPPGLEKRRCIRVNSRVPIMVEWATAGEVRCGETQTRIVGHYGCLMVLPHNLDVEQHIQITNLLSRQVNSAVVVWRGNQRAEGWELGVELINPQMGFWGLDL